MSIQVAQRISHIKPSATLMMAAKAAELKAQGKTVIDFSVGEPDFDTPSHIKARGIQAIEQGITKYTPVAGTPALKQAIVAKFARDNALNYTAKQILVSCGAKQSFYNLVQAAINDGDEVLIPAPYWVSYPEIVLLAGGKPVVIPTTSAQQFKITPAQLQAAITPKTRLIVINSPSNPSGMAYSENELSGLAEVLMQYPHIMIASDDMYEHILWQHRPFKNILNACPQLYDRTIVINGVSKAYAMTGWRIGYAAGPQEIITAMTTVQSQCTSNPCSISQAAACTALEGEQGCVSQMVTAFKERHDMAVAMLNEIPGVKCLPADGTFYLFPDVSAAIQQNSAFSDDVGLCEHLLTQAHVAMVPGSAFGTPGHVRLSIALDKELLKKGIETIKSVLG